MKKALATVTAAAALGGGLLMSAGTAGAAANGQCVKEGLATLKSLGAIPAAAQGMVDYSAFADAEEGPIFLDLPEGSYIPLNEVIKLHTTNPELFAWCQ